MATTTPNFGWPVPTSTDLVKDGATAIEALGDGIDTSLVDLKGGLTGQVLAKTTNTDMDFTWVTTDDANAIQNAIVNAKGDIIGASANDVPAITSAGANGTNLVADSTTTTGLRWQDNYAAAKNKIINGDFGIFQRSTSATVSADATYYAPDRWKSYYASGGTTVTWSRQPFTAGAAPVAGYEGIYFSRISAASSFSAGGEIGMYQPIENVQTLAGQTITVSFFAKADSARNSSVYIAQNFGSGGSAPVSTLTTKALTTSWERYSVTVTLGSLTGKTIGTGSSLSVGLFYTAGNATGAPVMDVWGFQVEAGSVATAFQTATGTIQGELAACQRYYWRWGAQVTGGNPMLTPFGTAASTTQAVISIPTKVTMRATPTLVDYGGTITLYDGVAAITAGVVTLANGSQDNALLIIAATGLTQYRPYATYSGATAAFFGISAEL